ncbi:hypothetical protein AB0C33_26615 [Nonomuraea sp. NPDC048881]|uniref:hypothetical protein n=1 Tax=unclassified Nonomuraea TaxID=2593643 RepID=UPI0033E6634D
MAPQQSDLIDALSIVSDLDRLGDSPIGLTVRELLEEPRQAEDCRKFDNSTPPPPLVGDR